MFYFWKCYLDNFRVECAGANYACGVHNRLGGDGTIWAYCVILVSVCSDTWGTWHVTVFPALPTVPYLPVWPPRCESKGESGPVDRSWGHCTGPEHWRHIQITLLSGSSRSSQQVQITVHPKRLKMLFRVIARILLRLVDKSSVASVSQVWSSILFPELLLVSCQIKISQALNTKSIG